MLQLVEPSAFKIPIIWVRSKISTFLVNLVKIIQENFKISNLVFFPFVHTLDMADIYKYIGFVKLFKTTVVNTYDFELAVIGWFGGIPVL